MILVFLLYFGGFYVSEILNLFIFVMVIFKGGFGTFGFYYRRKYGFWVILGIKVEIS